MIKLKACPKCHGDMTLGKDQYGSYLSCLQCGSIKELTEVSLAQEAKQPVPETEKMAA